MSYQVLARKWRPTQFDDVVGQTHVIQTLKNAIESERIAHAYLFVGPRGIGKTSIARIFAKALNCQSTDKPTGTPCDACDSCLEIAAGRSLDVMEIDGASNNRVDEVRDLRDAIRFAPTRSRFKIYIIDEVHMLTASAFNALLKTLEEPPPHVKFMFATTEPEKVLPTIISRCQRFDLRRIEAGLIAERLGLIAAADGIEADHEALMAVARGAEGGMRDAQSALDQLISFCGKQVREEDVLTVFGLVSRQTLEGLIGQVLSGDVAGLLETVAVLDDAGKNLERLASELMSLFRSLLVCLNVSAPGKLLDIGADSVASLVAISGTTDTEKVLRVTEILADVGERMRYALSKRTLLETALVRSARAASVVSIEDILVRLGQLESGVVSAGGGVAMPAPVPAAAPSAPVVAPPVAAAPPPVAAVPAPPKRAPTPVAPPVEMGETVARKPAPDPKRVARSPISSAALRELRRDWRVIAADVGCKSLGMHDVLLQTAPAAIDGDAIVVHCLEPAFNRLGEKAPVRIVKSLEAVVSAACDRPMAVRFERVDALPEIEVPAPVVVEAPTVEPTDAAAAASPRVTVQELVEDPSVQMVLDNFNGSITDVREAR